MFYRKRIKELELKAAKLENKLNVLNEAVLCLTEEMAVAHLDSERVLDILEADSEKHQDRIAAIKRNKEVYEKKLARFVRNNTTRRRVANKTTNGEENSNSK